MKIVNKLRTIMKNNNIDHYIITSNDPHQSEYVADYYKGRAYISGFTGSAGTLLVSSDKAKLWTDGRYFIQAENELKGSGIELMKIATAGYPTLEEYIKENVKENETLGICGNCYAASAYKKLLEIAEENNFKINLEHDLLNHVWNDRPELPKEKIFLHNVMFSGESAREKILRIRKRMSELKADNFILSSLDDIAWTFNIRGNDVKFNPVALAYALISQDAATLYIDKKKVTDEIIRNLNYEGVKIKNYDDIFEDVRNIKTSVFIDLLKTNAEIYNAISKEVKVIEGTNITTELKAIKNYVELASLDNCQVRDGVAMVRFIKWLKESVGKIEVTELSATEKLSNLRAEGINAKGDSFGTIAGYKDHAAMMHYSANEESDYEIKEEGLFLVDSGGQYLDGTTDITRTFVMGDLTEEEKIDYTLVLKGHIDLSMAKFLKGTTGMHLDILARAALWKHGIDYKCGTGHGVGFFLSVHEGPQGIRPSGNTVVLEPGMILTNEPGVYKEGKHGIRIENTLVVIKDEANEFGDFYSFKTISYCPIDLGAVIKDMLTKDEINWLNNYHETVYIKLAPFLNDEEKVFLKEITREI